MIDYKTVRLFDYSLKYSLLFESLLNFQFLCIAEEPKDQQPTIKVPQDKLLAELVLKHKDAIWKIHDHDSLLEHQGLFYLIIMLGVL